MAWLPNTITIDTRQTQIVRQNERWSGTQVFQVEATDDFAAIEALDAVGVGENQTVRKLDGSYVAADAFIGAPVYVRLTTQSLARVGLGQRGLIEVEASIGYRDRASLPQPDQPDYQWSPAEGQVVVDVDRDGKPITNRKKVGEDSNGDPIFDNELFEPHARTILVPSRRLTVRWYVNDVNLPWLLSYDGAINSDTWRIGGRWAISPGQALCHGIFAEDQDGVGGRALLSGSFEFLPGGELWDPRQFLNATRDENGNLIMLDKNGEFPDQQDFGGYFLKYKIHPVVQPFSPLGI